MIGQRIVLVRHPDGDVQPNDFRCEAIELGAPEAGHVLLRTVWLSLDPFIRLGLSEAPLGGANAVKPGQVVTGAAVSEVIASNNPDLPVGVLVEGRTGWQSHSVSDGTGLRQLEPGETSRSALSITGLPGLTAHTGMIPIGGVKAGETVVITAAAGAVGTIAGQIAKLKGARVVGSAGGPEKCRWLVDTVGFDAALDYRADDYAEQLVRACPDGADLFLENVGGRSSDPVYEVLGRGARVAVCGLIALYGRFDDREAPGPDRLPRLLRNVMGRGLTIRAFSGVPQAEPGARGELARWMNEGAIRPFEVVAEGLEAAPAAFAGMFGRNDYFGKVMVRVGDEAAAR